VQIIMRIAPMIANVILRAVAVVVSFVLSGMSIISLILFYFVII